MKSKLLPLLSTFTVVATIPIAQAWQPVGDHIKTRWAMTQIRIGTGIKTRRTFLARDQVNVSVFFALDG